MKNSMVSMIAAAVLAAFLVSCVSLQDKEMTMQEKAQANIVGSVEVKFTSFQPFNITGKKKLEKKAYIELMKAAQKQYQGNIEVRNILITGGWSGWEAVYLGSSILIGFFANTIIWGGVGFHEEEAIGYGASLGGFALAGNFQKITATGDVVLLSSQGASQTNIQRMEGALTNAAETLIDSMPRDATIAILSIHSDDRLAVEYVIDELEYKLVGARKFQIVDRRRLEQIRREQNFQMSGEVDDNSAISIGNMLGASIVITGDINANRLVLRALDVKTAQIVTMARERF
ncbi:MAG: penicillin-binding protein activator LpoB [Treponema sp.]|nr:penicillin-binding protein activator LpoB [Treponema sp.]